MMRTFQRLSFGFAILYLLSGWGTRAVGQGQGRIQAEEEVKNAAEVLALTYPESRTISVKFDGTYRLPRASGEAKVERKKGTTEIEIELDEMKPAFFFGGDYWTYALWIISPEGHTDNLGEFILAGNRSKLNVSTPLKTFGMIITAEPHFLVDKPSPFVVLQNTSHKRTITPINRTRIEYELFEGFYSFEQESLTHARETWREERIEVPQASTAVALAERAGARKYAAEELAQARELLRRTREASEVGVDKDAVRNLARDVVRLAVKAQKLAEARTFHAVLEAERQVRAKEIDTLQRGIQEAETELERARLLTEERELQIRMEKERAERIRREREESLARLQAALGYVAETRRSARGLIVDLADILFEFNKATLRLHAREVLSKLAGILLVTRDIRLSIEGHTDSIGTEEYNQALSETRARSVRDYLAAAGVPPDIMTTRGFGESRPIATNTTAANQQKNRRVEIVIMETPLAEGTWRRPRFAVKLDIAYENQSHAEALAEELHSQYSTKAMVVPVALRGKTLYQVSIPAESEAEAKRLAARISAEGKFRTLVVPLP
jgi:outer membrane protein OmpA-like peptidoglycan-associated protein